MGDKVAKWQKSKVANLGGGAADMDGKWVSNKRGEVDGRCLIGIGGGIGRNRCGSGGLDWFRGTLASEFRGIYSVS